MKRSRQSRFGTLAGNSRCAVHGSESLTVFNVHRLTAADALVALKVIASVTGIAGIVLVTRIAGIVLVTRIVLVTGIVLSAFAEVRLGGCTSAKAASANRAGKREVNAFKSAKPVANTAVFRGINKMQVEQLARNKARESGESWFLTKYNDGSPITANHLLAFLDDHPFEFDIIFESESDIVFRTPLDVKMGDNNENIAHLMCRRHDLTPDLLRILHCKFSTKTMFNQKRGNKWFKYRSSLIDYDNPDNSPYLLLLANKHLTYDLLDYFVSNVEIEDGFEVDFSPLLTNPAYDELMRELIDIRPNYVKPTR